MLRNSLLKIFFCAVVALVFFNSCGVFNRSRCGDCPKFNSIEAPICEEIPC